MRENMCSVPVHLGDLCLGHCLLPDFPEALPSQPVSPALFWLQVITLEGWVEIMYYVMDAHSFYNFIYFILLIIVSVKGAGALRASSRTHGPGDQRVFGSPQGAL